MPKIVHYRASILEELAPVSEHAELRFVDADGEWVSVSLRDGVVEVSGSRSIMISPRAGNLIAVRLSTR